jgi:hypothetical protein
MVSAWLTLTTPNLPGFVSCGQGSIDPENISSGSGRGVNLDRQWSLGMIFAARVLGRLGTDRRGQRSASPWRLRTAHEEAEQRSATPHKPSRWNAGRLASLAWKAYELWAAV